MSNRTRAVLRSVGLVMVVVSFAVLMPAGAGQPALADPGPAGLASTHQLPVAASGRVGRSGSKLLTCGASGNDLYRLNSSTYQTLRTCSLRLPEAGQIFVSANGSVGYEDAYTRALLRVKMNGGHLTQTDRYISVFSDTGDGSDASFALSGLFAVPAGDYTIELVGTRDAGSGTMRVYDPTLTLLFVPGTGTDLLACSDMDATMFITTSSKYRTMRSCTLTLPSDGWAFISADATAWGPATPFEAAFDIGIDSTSGSSDATRWVDAYHASGRAVDRTAALTLLKPVSAGRRTFNFLARRQTGTSDIRVSSPALLVIYVPASSPHVKSCSVLDSTPWDTTSGDFSVVRQCSMTLLEDSVAFMAADANLGIADGVFEAHLRLGIDSTEGLDDTNRYTNVYGDSYDGTDDSAALSVLKPVAAGSHTFYFLARSMRGMGHTLLRYPTLTVLVPVTTPTAQHFIYLPVLQR